jgi:XapX domain-containing protein
MGEFVMQNLREIMMSIIAGMIVGFIFSKLLLPIPAPPNIPAFMGIFGVWLGAIVVDKIGGLRA